MTPTLTIGWRRFQIEVKEFFRERESVVFTFSLPVLLMLIFGSVFAVRSLQDLASRSRSTSSPE